MKKVIQASTDRKGLANQRGVTLVEIMIGLAISVFVFMALIGAFLGVKSLNELSERYLQASLIVRGQMEAIKGTAYAAIAAANAEVAYDAGPDATWNTADDLTGTLTTTLADGADFDGDGNIAENAVSVDGNASNDTVALPVNVTFTWEQRVLGGTKQYSISANTLVAA